MKALIEPKRDGTVAMQLDIEAVQAMFASVMFASQFHERIRPFAGLLEDSLQNAGVARERRMPCQ